MDCPQCGAAVSSDDAFCGKCGYAMREGAPERLDQSRIRVHEEPETSREEPSGGTSTPKSIRRKTMVGMPSVTPRRQGPPTKSPEAPEEPEPPAEIAAARGRAQRRTPQKTMLGIPRPDFAAPPDPLATAETREPSGEVPTERFGAPSETGFAPRVRERARVRYDSVNEPYPMLQRRKKALRGLALLVFLAAAWFAYRFFTLNG